MTIGRSAANSIKIKTDGEAGLRAVECACCGGCRNDCQYPEHLWQPQYDPACICGSWTQINYGESPDCCPETREKQGLCNEYEEEEVWNGCETVIIEVCACCS